MATTHDPGMERRILEIESSGSAVEAVGGFVVVILSILGLTGVQPFFLASSAGIIFGVALLAQGAAVGSEYSALVSRATGGAFGAVELGGGMTIEFLAGGGTVVLGVLALMGVAPMVLLPTLVIAAGTAIILTTGTMQRLNTLKMEASGASDFAQRIARYGMSGIVGVQFLSGLAAIVLGILALVYLPTPLSATMVTTGTWMTLTVVGLLVLGSSIMMSGGALAGRLLQMFERIRS